MLEALILASTNPQYDKILFIDLPVQYMKTTRTLSWKSKQKNSLCTQHVLSSLYFMYWTGKSMINFLSNCGLVDARISASEKDLPVSKIHSKQFLVTKGP